MNISKVIAKVINSPDHILRINMPLYSKARPRVASGRAYMPAAYRKAQQEMRKQMAEQWTLDPFASPIAIHIEMHGEGRGDLDNMAGFVLDAAGPSKGHPGLLWVDDRVTIISCLSTEWHRAPKRDSYWIIKILGLVE